MKRKLQERVKALDIRGEITYMVRLSGAKSAEDVRASVTRMKRRRGFNLEGEAEPRLLAAKSAEDGGVSVYEKKFTAVTRNAKGSGISYA